MKRGHYPLHPHHMILLWWSTFLGMLAVAPVANTLSAIVLIVSFVLVSKVFPSRWWTPVGRFSLFALLLGAVVVLAGGLNREMGTSIFMATIIIKFVEIKRMRDGAVMVVFNTISPFLAFLQDQTPLVLVLGLLSLLLTLSVSKTMTESQWEEKNKTFASRAIGSVLLQIALSVPLAVAAYMVVPRTDNPMWGNLMQQKSKTGVSEEMNISRWTNLLKDYSTAFRVRFNGKAPPPQDMYYRGVTLWTFDGQTWKSEPVDPLAVQPNVRPRGQANTPKSFTYSISYEDVTSSRLFALDYPVNLPQSVYVSSDDQLTYNGRNRAQNMIYWSSGPGQFEPLTDAQRNSALQLPEGSNLKTVELGRQWRAEAKTDQEFIQRVLHHFRDNFSYSLTPQPVRPKHAVDDFVFETKTGFCAHFSSAFAVMMRAGNIPTRVVNGYAGFELSELGDYYRVRQSDAHAWVEVWQGGAWVRLDPTAQVSTDRQAATLGWGLLNTSHEVADWFKDKWNSWVLFYDEAAQEKMISDVKTKIGNISDKWSWATTAWSLLGLCAVVGLLVSLKILRRTPDKKALLRRVNQWFDQWGPWEDGASWSAKWAVAQLQLSEHDATRAKIILDHIQSYLYDPSFPPQSFSSRDVAELMKIKKK